MSEDFNAVVLATLLRLEGGVTRLEGSVTRLEGSVTRLESGQAALGSRQAELRAELRAELHAVRNAVMDRIDRLQDDLSKTRGDLGVNMGGIEHVWRQIAADRDAIDGLRETIAVMQRQIRRLQDPDGP